jgi:glycosyltransferase involved in cell wall biosynthesis
MKLAMVSEHASPLAAIGGVDAGGQNVHVAALAAALALRGHDVTVFTRRDCPDLPRVVRTPDGYAVHHLDAGPACAVPKDELLPYIPQMSAALGAELERQPVDAVHAHFWMSGLAALTAARPLGLPVVLTYHALGRVKRRHQGARDTSPRSRGLIEAQLCHTVDHIVATSSDEIRELLEMGADVARTTVVPCGVDIEHFNPTGPCEPPGARPRLLALGRLVERKGVADVIRALPGLDADLVVAGGPPLAELHSDPEAGRLRLMAAELGVEDRVEFRGAVSRSDVPALIRSCDIAVAVPWYEPFGIVPLEAMACGRPVVASRVGGLCDTVVEGRTGLLVPPQDPSALREALSRLLASPALRQQLGAAGLARVRTRYTWDRVARDTESVYRRLAQRRAGPIASIAR